MNESYQGIASSQEVYIKACTLTIISLVVMADTYVVDMRVLVSDDDDDNESLCNESTTGDEEHDKGPDGAADAVDIAVLPFDVSEDSDDNDEGLIDESTNTDDEERDTIAATANAEDESRFDKPTTTERPTYQNILSIWHYPQYATSDWWHQRAPPPVLVNLCLEESCDIDISDNEQFSRLSYWSLPFPKKPFREHGQFNLHPMMQQYKNYLLNDQERLYHLPGLSGLRLGCHGFHTTHGHVLVQLFDELKLTMSHFYGWQYYSGVMPTALRREEQEAIERYNDHRRSPLIHDSYFKKDTSSRDARKFGSHRRHRYRASKVSSHQPIRDRRSRALYCYIPDNLAEMSNYKEYVKSYKAYKARHTNNL